MHYGFFIVLRIPPAKLMTNALGLGTFFSRFFVRAAQENKDILDFIGVRKGKQAVTCIVIGYPKVKYLRTVPRKDADICWKSSET